MAVLAGKGLPSAFRRLDNYTFGGGRAPGAEYQLGRFGRAAESVVHTPGTAGHRADRSKSAGPRLSFTAGTAAEDVRTLRRAQNGFHCCLHAGRWRDSIEHPVHGGRRRSSRGLRI